MRRSISSKILAILLLLPSGLIFAQANDFTFYSELAQEWYRGGEYFEWTSTTVNNNNAKVNVFYQTFGDSSNPQLLIIHGFPNSSFDFRRLIPLLEDDYYIAALDFPGSGFCLSSGFF